MGGILRAGEALSDAPLSQEAIDALLAAAMAASAVPTATSDAPVAPKTASGGRKSGGASGDASAGVGQGDASPTLELMVGKLDVGLVVVLGETEMRLSDILSLGPGSIIELDHLVGTPFDVRLAGRTVARGEVVVVDDTYAIRIAENLVRRQP